MFSWDEKKRQTNWEKRRVDFAKMIKIFDDPSIVEVVDARKSYGEPRIQALGQADGVSYLVVYTWRDDTRHIITAWKVGEDGKKRYQNLFTRGY